MNRTLAALLWLACLPQHIVSSSCIHHFRNPMAAHIDGAQPFETGHAWS